MTASEQITVKQLYELCKIELNKGNGDLPIVIADDNEGNGFHGMFYGFTRPTEEDKDCFDIYDSQEDDPLKVIVLG